MCSVARGDTHIHTERHTNIHTDTNVNTEDTLSGFQDLFLQPIIKDLSIKVRHIYVDHPVKRNRENGLYIRGPVAYHVTGDFVLYCESHVRPVTKL